MSGLTVSKRAALTGLLLAFVLAGQWVWLPGIAEVIRAHPWIAGYQITSVLGLGLMPYVDTAAFAMLLSAVMPPLARLRDGVTPQRAAFDTGIGRASFVFAIVLALIQLTFMSHWLAQEGFSFSWQERCVLVVTPVAGFLLVLFLAFRITAMGMGNGVALILVLTAVVQVLVGLGSQIRQASTTGGGAAGSLLAIALVAFVVWACVFYLNDRVDLPLERTDAASSRRHDAPIPTLGVRLNFAGTIPGTLARGLLALFLSTLRFFPSIGLPIGGGVDSVAYVIALILLTACLGLLLTFAAFDTRKVEPLLDTYGYRIAGLPEGVKVTGYLDHILRRRLPLSVLTIVLISATQFVRLVGFRVKDAGVTGFVILAACAVGKDTWRIVQSRRQMWSLTEKDAEADSGSGSSGSPDPWTELAIVDTELEAKLIADRLEEQAITARVLANRALCMTGTLGLWESAPPRYPFLFVHRRLGGGRVVVAVRTSEASPARALLEQFLPRVS